MKMDLEMQASGLLQTNH